MQRLMVTILCGLFVGALFLVPCGCEKGEAPKPPPPPPPPAAAKAAPVKLPGDLAALQTEAEKGKTQLDATMGALDALVAGTGDAKPRFDAFKAAVAALEAQAGTVRARADAMRDKGKDYFKTWDEQLATIGTPEIRAAAEKRRNEIAQEYEKITANMATARTEYDGLVAYLKDLQKVAESDPSADGLKALAPKTAPAKESTAKVKTAVDAVNANLKKIEAIYSPGA